MNKQDEILQNAQDVGEAVLDFHKVKLKLIAILNLTLKDKNNNVIKTIEFHKGELPSKLKEIFSNASLIQRLSSIDIIAITQDNRHNKITNIDIN